MHANNGRAMDGVTYRNENIIDDAGFAFDAFIFRFIWYVFGDRGARWVIGQCVTYVDVMQCRMRGPEWTFKRTPSASSRKSEFCLVVTGSLFRTIKTLKWIDQFNDVQIDWNSSNNDGRFWLAQSPTRTPLGTTTQNCANDIYAGLVQQTELKNNYRPLQSHFVQQPHSVCSMQYAPAQWTVTGSL